LLTVALLLATVSAGPARAQDEEEEDAPAPAVQAARVVFMNDAQFDQWVFGNVSRGNASVARDKVDSLLTLLVDDLERSCALTAVQKKKLLLAGRGDIKRFFDRVEEMRKKFDKVKNDPNAVGMIWQEVQPLQTAFNAGLFSGESIFSKTIKTTLSPEQAAQHEKSERDRLLYHYWARVDLALELLNNSVGFTTEQREQLWKLLAEEARPPQRLGRNDYWAVLYQLGLLPEAKIKPIFDDLQWGLVSRQLAQAKGMGMWLKQNGFVPAESPASTPALPVAKPIAKPAKLRAKSG
jgi:hypothetical protein